MTVSLALPKLCHVKRAKTFMNDQIKKYYNSSSSSSSNSNMIGDDNNKTIVLLEFKDSSGSLSGGSGGNVCSLQNKLTLLQQYVDFYHIFLITIMLMMQNYQK